jgi:hypothetical protein
MPWAVRRRVGALLLAGVLLGAVAGCTSASDGGGSDGGGSDGGAGAGDPTGSGAVALPLENAAFDYQLGGGYPPPDGVTVVVRDSTDPPADGLYSICYVNGFQTQPGADWPAGLVLHDASGAEVSDPEWPDERLLDIGDAAKRTEIAARQRAVVEGCRDAGFEAVEFDNLDSYTRSGGGFDLDSAVAFAGLLVEEAHRAGLAAGQKNTPELGDRGAREIGFDFAVAEQCALYDECAAYTHGYGGRVFDIEYADDLDDAPRDFAALCGERSTPPNTILRDLDLTPAGDEAHVYESC